MYGDDNKKEVARVKKMITEKFKSKREREIAIELKDLKNEQEQIRNNKTLCCPHCEKRTQIKKLTIVDAHHYIRPYSCTGGDYWTFSDEYYVICPKCDSAIRTYLGSWDYSTPYEEKKKEEQDRIKRYHFLHKFHQFFGERLNMYKDGGITSIDLDKLRDEKKAAEERNRY